MVAANNAIYNTVGASISGVTNTLTITNPSNTASSAARETIVVGGGTAGDPTINWNVSGVTNWEMGIDNSVSDNLTISQGTALGTNDTWRMDTSGRRTLPLQPAFLGILESNDLNVTGDTSVYTLGTVTALTKIFDRGNNFTTAGVFTAPVTGIYLLQCQFKMGNIAAAHNIGTCNIFTTAKAFPFNTVNPGAVRTTGGFPNLYVFSGSIIANMSAGDTAICNIRIDGSTKTVAADGDANGNTFFCGFLLA